MSHHILVVGGAGYIGSHVVLSLLESNKKVTVLDNLSSGQQVNLFDQAEFIKGDILDRAFLQQVFETSYDAVIHLAGRKAAGESMLKPELYARQNITGTLNLLEAISNSSCKKFIFSSTASVYGDPQYIPMDEKHPIDPINFYGYTKCEVERQLVWYDRLRDIKSVSLRYFNAAGYDLKKRIKGIETNPANLIPIVMETALGKRKEMEVYGNDYSNPDGTCLRDYIHVSDLAQAHNLAFDWLLKNQKTDVMNLGTETTHSVLEVIHAAEEITGQKIPYRIVARRPGDPPVLCAKAEKAGHELSWKPLYSDLKTLINSTWEIYDLSASRETTP